MVRKENHCKTMGWAKKEEILVSDMSKSAGMWRDHKISISLSYEVMWFSKKKNTFVLVDKSLTNFV